ncbi:MAG: choline trimethylamine-lyase [Solidesulfovibrio sp.]
MLDAHVASASHEDTTELTTRVEALRKAYLAAKPSVSIARAKAFTKVYRDNPGMPSMLLRAMAFKRACESAPLAIFDNELIVSHPAGARRAGEISPDIAWRWVSNELDTLSSRPQDPYAVCEEDKRVLREEIFPFWEGRSVDEISETQLRQAGLWEFTTESCICDVSIKTQNGGGDTCPGYDNILLVKGIAGIMAEARAHLDALSMANKNDIDRIHFYTGIVLTCQGIVGYADRYAHLAESLARLESKSGRKAELTRIAEICRRVPAMPPRTFQEALQSVWFAQSLFTLEENQTGISLGRADQYLYPYYKADIEAGRLTEKEARELICCWLIKMAELMWLVSKETAMYFAGYQPFINLVVGGQKRQGGDATNALTFLFMDCSKTLGLYQPSLAVRIHNTTPRALLKKVVDVVRSGIGFPACHFDDAHIKMMLRKGFDYEDARDYCLMGCVEPQKSGRIYQWTSVGYTNWPVAIEFALNDGIFPHDGRLLGLKTGELASFATFEAFETAVKRQIRHITAQAAMATLLLQRIHRDYAPKPLVSCLVEGCMESGKNVMDGGAFLNNGPGLIWTGMADYANSMAAVKRLVYEEGKYTLTELAQALAANFQGYDAMRRDCLAVAKFGNDDDRVDLFAKELVDFTEQAHKAHAMLYGPMSHGTLSISNNTPQGMIIGALPSGRLAGQPLADGISPSQQTDRKGPTATIKSVSKINVESMEIGQVHNFKLMAGLLDTPDAENALIGLLQTASILGNAQMQFSYVDNETLRQAQQEPDQYRGLMIRVAGYSAFFVELCREVQDEIISRTTLTAFH